MIRVLIHSYKVREIAKTDPDRYAWLKEQQPSLPVVEKAVENYPGDFDQLVNEVGALPEWITDVCEIKIVRPLKLLSPDRTSIQARNLKELLQCAQVHLPGNELLRVIDTKAIVDACSDDLAENLKAGWRIIAVCPQPGQRRPDYVLGMLPPLPTIPMSERSPTFRHESSPAIAGIDVPF